MWIKLNSLNSFHSLYIFTHCKCSGFSLLGGWGESPPRAKNLLIPSHQEKLLVPPLNNNFHVVAPFLFSLHAICINRSLLILKNPPSKIVIPPSGQISPPSYNAIWKTQMFHSYLSLFRNFDFSLDCFINTYKT